MLLVLLQLNCLQPDSRHDNDQNSATIKFCTFSRTLAYSGQGGCIYVSSISINNDISDCLFVNCSSYSHGGAIFLESGGILIQRVCSTLCNTDSGYGQFGYLSVKDSNRNNVLNFTSVSYSANKYWATPRYYPTYHLSGIQKVQNTNSSYNSNYHHSGIGIDNPNTYYSSFCTFFSNHAIQYDCIIFIAGTGSRIVENTNVVNNTQDTTNRGTIRIYNNAIISMIKSIFAHNNHFLFHAPDGSLTIIDCIVCHLSGSIGNVIIGSNNEMRCDKETLVIKHYHSFLCEQPKQIGTSTYVSTTKVFVLFSYISYL